MFTRSAIFEGAIRPGKEDAFYKVIEEDLLAIWRRMPNVLDVRLFRPVAQDPGTPSILMVQQIDYPSLEAIDEAMASPERDEAVVASEPLADLYDGRHYHFVYDKVTG